MYHNKIRTAFFTYCLIATVFLLPVCVSAQPSMRIQVNQVGFYIQAPKLAVVTGNTTARTFSVINAKTKKNVFTGTLSSVKASANSSTKTRIADFSGLHMPGTYYVHVPSVGASYPFQVGENVHRAAALASLKGFYFIRSDVPLEAAFAGPWQRAAGHPDTAVYIHPSAADATRPAGTVISSPGGWYDAGYYN